MAGREERGRRDDLETRAFGLTSMIFAMAILGIYVSYATATVVLRAYDIPFYSAIAWTPWLFGASVMTGAVWRMRAKALGIERKPIGMQLTLLYKVLFLAALIGITFVSPSDQVWAHRTVAAGMFLLALAHIHDTLFDGRITLVPHLIAGGIAIAAALGLTYFTDLGYTIMGLIHGAVVGASLFFAGMYTYFFRTRRSQTGTPAQGPLEDHSPA